MSFYLEKRMASFETSDRTVLVVELSQSVTSTFFGYCEIRPPGWIKGSLLVASALAMAVAIVFTVFRMKELPTDDAKFTFAILILINTVLCIIFVFLGVFFYRIPELLVIVVAFLATVVILIIDAVQTTDIDWYIGVRLFIFIAAFFAVVPASCFTIKYNYRHRGKLPFYMGFGREDGQRKILWDNLFRSVLNLDLQISLTMVPIVWPEGIHFNEYDRYLIIPTAISSVGMFLVGHILVWLKERLVKPCRVSIYCIYSICWSVICLYAVFLMYETLKDLKENTNSTKAVDGIYYVALMASSLSLLLKVATLVLGIIVSRNIGNGDNTTGANHDVNSQEEVVVPSSNNAEPKQRSDGLESSMC
ncbi:uncharacterized protein LOC128553478 [Mercenaria mercenaria]|uniref:uncharacterized protein LOC128553478 n=1 Tax=Mercenaria mercenaria TaxID=6596 RepID=UPI00234F14A0|nr:uncharacterized protein LOC128553478 [Mercenaria mercenaria]